MWLVVKELHVQQMTLALIALYVPGWLVAVSFRRYLWIFFLLSIPYGMMSALVAGSIASAEERRLGTADSQTLLPMAASLQWAVKVAVALALGGFACIGLPFLLQHAAIRLLPFNAVPAGTFVVWPYVQVVVFVIMASLYASSLTTGGMRALLVALVSVVAAAWTADVLYERVHSYLHARPDGVRLPFEDVPTVLVLAAVAMLLHFGLTNHRSSDRGTGRIGRQAAWAVMYLALSIVAIATIRS